MSNCPFCDLNDRAPLWDNDLVVAIADGFPVSPGHTLIITRRHIATYFDATPWEQQALWQAVEAVKERLDRELKPDGYNVGFNAGRSAGQTVMHLHIHIIPRFSGDMADPSGGVRGVIPDKQTYTQSTTSLATQTTGPAICADMERLRTSLHILLDETIPIAERLDDLIHGDAQIKRLGKAV